MCYPATCTVCGKTTWNGCGQHVADVRRQVPATEWCTGDHARAENATAPSGGIFGRLFGRD